MMTACKSATFVDALQSGEVILLDGAMGTMLYARGVFIHRAFEELNLAQPGLVRDVHAAYVAAGADLIETNTFAANRFRLSPHGLAEQVSEINRRGVELAREAANGNAWVGGAMGPLGVRIEPFGPIALAEARNVFAEQATALAEAGVDAIVLETFAHLPELEEAIRAVRSVCEVPIIAQVAMSTGAVTREGVSAADAAQRMAAAGADVVGVNCSDALATLDALAEMAGGSTPLVGQPNAGQPRSVGGRKIYLASPEYIVAWGRRAIRSGARLLGGCCGTTPEHIKALRQVVRETIPTVAAAAFARPRDRAPAAPPVPRTEKSALAAALQAGRFAIGVEIPSRTGWEANDFLLAARRLALSGVGFVGLPEGPPHLAHLPPRVVANLIRHLGVEAIVHYTCRGRRLARMQSDLLGAYASGVSNLLLATGDPIIAGVEPDSWVDLEVDSIGAVNLTTRLNHGEDVGGNPIGRPTAFHVGIRVDAAADDLDRELSRLAWKVEAGAEFALTAPVFDPAALETFLGKMGSSAIPVVATIWPLHSARESEFFERRMASVQVPGPIVARMRRAEARGNEVEEGLAIACELAAAVKPLVQGLQVVAPGGRLAEALTVIDAVR